jgi:hypothetical protein
MADGKGHGIISFVPTQSPGRHLSRESTERRISMKLQSLGLIFLCWCLTACSGAAGLRSSAAVGTVLAAGFTAKNVSGGYGFSILTFGAVASGVITADGNGKITEGQETLNAGGLSCHGTLSGSYTINADGSGEATLFLTEDAISSAKGCQALAAHYSLALTNGGQQILIAEQDAAVVATGVAARQ